MVVKNVRKIIKRRIHQKKSIYITDVLASKRSTIKTHVVKKYVKNKYFSH